MKDKLVKFLLTFNGSNYSAKYKFFSILLGILFYLVILPMFIIWISSYISQFIPFINLSRGYEMLIAVGAIVIGIFFLVWTAVSHWESGKGTPVFNAPSQKLIISGPYKLTRNPIQLGAIFYFLGLGILYGGLTIGILTFILTTIGASMFHKLVEEEELIKKFGKEYEIYRKTTPFLFPNIFRKKD
ncbi:MAG: methyltransferase family protein [Dysgonomonas sp.]